MSCLFDVEIIEGMGRIAARCRFFRFFLRQMAQGAIKSLEALGLEKALHKTDTGVER